MMTALLSVGAWAADDLTLNPSETVAFGDWGFDNSAAPTLNFSNWAAGGGWQFATPLSQDDYCGVDFAMEPTVGDHVTFTITFEGWHHVCQGRLCLYWRCHEDWVQS